MQSTLNRGELDLFPNKEQVHIFWSLHADTWHQKPQKVNQSKVLYSGPKQLSDTCSEEAAQVIISTEA